MPQTQHDSYGRLCTTLAHREPDRIPFDLGGAEVAEINIHALNRLRRFLGLPGEAAIRNQVTQTGEVGDDLVDRLKIDVKNVNPRPSSSVGPARDLGLVGDHYRLIDEFGMGWQMPRDGGHYYDLYHSPLANAETVQDIDRYPWPNPLDPARFAGLKERADRVVLEEKRGLLLGRMSSGMWEHAMWMTGYEKFLAEMALNPALVHAIMSKELELQIQYWGRVLELLGDYTVVISTADDLGGQNGLLVSLAMYKNLIWPYHKQLFEFIKKKGGARAYVFFHNDGAIYETIPLLIEAGVDILNPWQVNCRGMGDTRKFKREYGRDLTIWGGSCDTQRVLPFGTPQEVRDETRRRIEDLAPGGGFVFAPIHIIQSDVPPENIMAWWETLQQYGRF